MTAKVLFLFVVFTSLYQLFESSRCKEDFHHLASNCFRFSSKLSTYQEAYIICRQLDSHLAEIVNEETQQQLATWIRQSGFRTKNYLIALQYNTLRSAFEWKNASSSYQAWDNHYPNQPITRQCTIMSQYSSLTWRNVRCDSKNLFICQHKPGKRNDSSNEEFSCLGKNGYFADPDSCSSYIHCASGVQNVYGCSVGNFNPVIKRCTKSYNCGNTQPEINEPANHPGSIPPKLNLVDFSTFNCEGDYIKNKGSCYKVYRVLKTQNDASEFCSSQDNATLVTIKSEKENRFLINLMFHHSPQAPIGSFWVGLTDREEPGSYVWSDNSPLLLTDFSSWSKRAKIIEMKKKKRRRDYDFWSKATECVAISKIYRKKWIDEMCSKELGFVCQKPAIPRRSKRQVPCNRCRKMGGNSPLVLAVIGGRNAIRDSSSSQVSLRNANGRHLCGGTLIDRCWVLTAAHCVAEAYQRDVINRPTYLVSGDSDLRFISAKEVNISFNQVIVHPDYIHSVTPVNDIALIRLDECLPDDKSTICLATSNAVRPETCKVVGFGTRDRVNELYSNILQEAIVPIINQRTCKRYFTQEHSDSSLITPQMLCAGYHEGKIDACTGDSGGPLFCRDRLSGNFVQSGIVSWGINCAAERLPGVYMRVSSYIDWIRQITNIEF